MVWGVSNHNWKTERVFYYWFQNYRCIKIHNKIEKNNIFIMQWLIAVCDTVLVCIILFIAVLLIFFCFLFLIIMHGESPWAEGRLMTVSWYGVNRHEACCGSCLVITGFTGRHPAPCTWCNKCAYVMPLFGGAFFSKKARNGRVLAWDIEVLNISCGF